MSEDPLIHTSEYLKYPQRKQNMSKFLVNFFLHDKKFGKGTILSKTCSENFTKFE